MVQSRGLSVRVAWYRRRIGTEPEASLSSGGDSGGAAKSRRAIVRDRRQGGFTLLELLVVLVILGLLIGLVGPAMLRQLGSAKEKIAHQSIERLAAVLDIYKLDIGSYPTTEQGLEALIKQPAGVARWNGPYLNGNKVPEDPWGHPFIYRNPSERPGHEYDLYSFGPTGQPGGTGSAAPIYNESSLLPASAAPAIG